MMKRLIETIKQDEGLRLFPYLDTVGVLTIGYGRNLDSKGISHDEAELMLRNDIITAQRELERVFPIASTLSKHRYHVLINMMYNLGATKFMGFRKMRKAIEEGDFEAAAREMLDSKWSNQVGLRADRLAKTMKRENVKP